MGYYSWKPYVPVADRRKQTAARLAKMRKKDLTVAPVVIEGRTIARSFWGKAWCSNLERYSDYANRLPRGRSYVRNGSVLDLKVAKGEAIAIVSGSTLYTVKIAIAPVTDMRWISICTACAGSIDSVVELLQGRLAKSVMDRVCREGDGLFPAPAEIKLSCNCPDSADMCKHVAAALYGIGARLDEMPELLFVLRGVDQQDLIASAGTDLSLTNRTAAKAKILAGDDLAALFGLDMADTGAETAQVKERSAVRAKPSRTKAVKMAGKQAASQSNASRSKTHARTRNLTA
jgi:uncharacterized Zn finger protein